jgi:hypothetical protein
VPLPSAVCACIHPVPPTVPVPPTTIELLRSQVDEVRQAFDAVLDHAQLRYDDINAGSPGVFVMGWNPHRWGPPREGAQRHFGEARNAWEPLHELAAQAIRRSAPERIRPLEDADKLLRRIIEQTDTYSGAPGGSLDDIRQRVARSLQRLADALADLPSAHGDGYSCPTPTRCCSSRTWRRGSRPTARGP